MNRRTKGIAIGTLVAGSIGYIAGILTAPKSGKETRKMIQRVRTEGFAEAEKQLKKLHTELSDLLGEADTSARKAAKNVKEKAGEAHEVEIVSRATRTRQKTREILSALHNGDADDKDLDNAVTEATKAIKSIRSFLKK